MIVNEYNGTINISSIYNGGTKIVIKIKFGDELLWLWFYHSYEILTT